MHFITLSLAVKVSCACHFLAQHTWLFQELKTSDNKVKFMAASVMMKIHT